MVHSCYICKISSEKDPTVSFHRFPKNVLQRAKWVDSLGLDGMKVSTSTKLCSKHFPEDSFRVRDGGRRDLKPSAIPSYKTNLEKMYSDDSIVPEEMLSEAPNSDLGKDDCENFTMFLTDNLELFPDHILKTDYLDNSDLLLNDSMETEMMDTESINIEMSNVLNPIFSERLSDLSSSLEISPSASISSTPTPSSAKTKFQFSPKECQDIVRPIQTQESTFDVDSLISKISADNNFKWRAYFKQCTVDDFSTPEMARRNIELGKKEIETHQKKIKILQQQNRRLKCRVARLKQLLKQCKQNNSVDIGNILDEDDEIDI
ncbi:uncharacterized protein LOC123319932 [Coccinella septempunctata]|uniref:uncharacterized protein LOC123319932 n=1 Tax=Coccinella septempunctata TaxID=41139 RepID=UPI001D07FDE9|nr:uncharacterized protein LOC123319932 [Coccinella septempunctata]